MTSLYSMQWSVSLNFFLVFLRLLGVFLLMPGFSSESIPVMIKIVLSSVLALVCYPIVRPYLPTLPESLGSLSALVLRETALGFVMGFGAFVTFEAIRLAAQFIGYQMGFGTAGLMDPLGQSNVSVLVPLYGWVALMVFFLADMHHEVLVIFLRSFEVTYFESVVHTDHLVKYLIAITSKLFVLAVQMAAPFSVLILCCNAVLGILSRMMPQLNVILFSFPITILLGFIAFYVLAPEIVDAFEKVMGRMSEDITLLLRGL